jgi:hypothetical protein
MVIIIVPELEFDEVELADAVASILGVLSLLAGSVDPIEEAPPKNKKIARTEATHTNLTSRLNVPSSHPDQGSLDCPDLFSQKNPFPKNTHSLSLSDMIQLMRRSTMVCTCSLILMMPVSRITRKRRSGDEYPPQRGLYD